MLKGIFLNEKDMRLISETITNIDEEIVNIVIKQKNNEEVLKSVSVINGLVEKLQKQLGLQ